MSSARRHAVRRDLYEPQIIEAFEAAGATVQQLSAPGCPDLLVGFLGRDRLVEVKTDNAGLEALQVIWHNRWKGNAPVVVRNVPQAHKWIRMWTKEFAASKGWSAPADLVEDLSRGVGR